MSDCPRHCRSRTSSSSLLFQPRICGFSRTLRALLGFFVTAAPSANQWKSAGRVTKVCGRDEGRNVVIDSKALKAPAQGRPLAASEQFGRFDGDKEAPS